MTRILGISALLGAVSGLAFAATASAAPAVSGAAASELQKQTAVTSAAATTDTVSFEVFLPLRNEAALDSLIEAQQDASSPSYHQWLTPAQFSAKFGPTAASVAKVKAALTKAGLQVSAAHSRSLTVSGTVGAVNAAFATSLQHVTQRNGSRRLVSRTVPVLPADLLSEGATVVNFTGLPPKHVSSAVTSTVVPANRLSNVGGYYFTDLRQAYDFPAYDAKIKGKKIADGTGVSVAVLMSSDALDSDIKAHFDHEKFTAITGKPAPTITHLPINGGGPPIADNDAFDEASLDVQEVLGGAPGAAVTLVNIPSLSDSDIISGYLTIVEDNAWDIVNSSFGGCELLYSAAYNGGQDFTGILKTYDTLFKQGNAQGITFVASSGDEGGLSCPDANYFTTSTKASKFVASVEFPSDSPHVTGVGGTNLITTTPPNPQTTPPKLTSKYVMENAQGDPEIPYDPYGLGKNVSGGYWGAGGGRSTVFSAPAYQAKVDTGSPQRTIPDVGMQVGGCPAGISQLPCGPNRSFVIIYANGTPEGLIGTSVSSPEFVGAAALFIEANGRQGNLNTYLYKEAAKQLKSKGNSYHIAIPGFDGKWSDAQPGGAYDYLVGNGTPRVRALFGFNDLPATGNPQTATNP